MPHMIGQLRTPSCTFLLVLVLAIGGCATLLSYIHFLPRVQPSKPISALWFGIKGPLRNVFYVSMFVSMCSFLAIVSWLILDNQCPLVHLWLPLFIFFLGTSTWSVALWRWGVTGGFVWAVLLSLVATTTGAAWLWWSVKNRLNAPWWVVWGTVAILFHVGVLDNIGWFVAFLNAQQGLYLVNQ